MPALSAAASASASAAHVVVGEPRPGRRVPRRPHRGPTTRLPSGPGAVEGRQRLDGHGGARAGRGRRAATATPPRRRPPSAPARAGPCRQSRARAHRAGEPHGGRRPRPPWRRRPAPRATAAVIVPSARPGSTRGAPRRSRCRARAADTSTVGRSGPGTSAWPSSSSTTASSARVKPWPPCSSGRWSPSHPWAAIFSHTAGSSGRRRRLGHRPRHARRAVRLRPPPHGEAQGLVVLA